MAFGVGACSGTLKEHSVTWEITTGVLSAISRNNFNYSTHYVVSKMHHVLQVLFLFFISMSTSFYRVKHFSLLDENFQHRKKSCWVSAFLPRLLVYWVAKEAAGQYFTSYNLKDLKQFGALLHTSRYCTWFVLNVPSVACVPLSCRCKNNFVTWWDFHLASKRCSRLSMMPVTQQQKCTARGKISWDNKVIKIYNALNWLSSKSHQIAVRTYILKNG